MLEIKSSKLNKQYSAGGNYNTAGNKVFNSERVKDGDSRTSLQLENGVCNMYTNVYTDTANEIRTKFRWL